MTGSSGPEPTDPEPDDRDRAADPAEDAVSDARSSVRRTDTTDPRRARARALKILFQADIRAVPAAETLQRSMDEPDARAMLDDADALSTDEAPRGPQTPGARAGTTAGRQDRSDAIDGFTRALVLGVAEHQAQIDTLIARYARRWQISRMPVVDRTVLRLATYELLYEPTPPAVVIHEAVEMAKSLSTDDSGRYVNGVLESIRKDVAARG
jgi:transcription antitermination factor NusB